jgi:hypothetical protein
LDFGLAEAIASHWGLNPNSRRAKRIMRQENPKSKIQNRYG